ncbi:hypothetical protein CBR_g12330 [Chara braunii]|uniref:Uncharacterized protein n=1 Tax=Chara braunii TaxID=69332 RepID=A0A388KRW9_CHABU|nr:hypothetical protein CBR_g12330 [Chara braunii]|eukprot:GBG72762.1 hypothetical protein CBR_g12330 [Chara braunii]
MRRGGGSGNLHLGDGEGREDVSKGGRMCPPPRGEWDTSRKRTENIHVGLVAMRVCMKAGCANLSVGMRRDCVGLGADVSEFLILFSGFF